ncbi:DUF742 domain-containing protein [Streptomyces sp. VRA16 Mangrove soil]|uniref:DUF742 domain-containing protein n=1 Tax=Streptomyces sp. VRA16 Mangrove soil TaxID=2817434 RepID=UPI0027DE8E08|nr:DUF742 domain-containing protein [Streptomyces sp. VRA16 Mangrove soil]
MRPDHSDAQPWVSQEAATVRMYAVTGGRTRASRPLDLTTLLRTAARARLSGRVAEPGPEGAEVLRLCGPQALSVAELAARLRLPVPVTQVILSDLIDSRVLIPVPAAQPGHASNPRTLEAVLEGLRAL